MDHKEPNMPPTKRRLKQLIRMAEQSRMKEEQQTAELKSRSGLYTNSGEPGNSENVPYPLTREEALEFVKMKLNIPDPESMAAKDRIGFLNLLTEQLKENMPFTNMHAFLPTPIWDLNPDDHKKLILSLEGGVCWMTNPFTKALLEYFDYRCHHIIGHDPWTETDDDHISTIVEDATYPGSLHLVDPGTRRDLCAAIPLDFEWESPVYEFHHTKAKFFKEGHRLIWCGQQSVTTNPGWDTIYDSSGKAWRQQLIYYLDERTNWHTQVQLFCQSLRIVGLRNLLPPWNGLVFSGYLNEDQIIYIQASHESAVTHLYQRYGPVQRATMSKPALLRLFRENFPQYSEERLHEVFEMLRIVSSD